MQKINEESSEEKESELDLFRTILGEQVPVNILLHFLNCADFNVSNAVNLYFAHLQTLSYEHEQEKKKPTKPNRKNKHLNINDEHIIRIKSGMRLTLHQAEYEKGMIGNFESYATFTNGQNELHEQVTTANEKYRTIRLWKRNHRLQQHQQQQDVSFSSNSLYFQNDDIVSLECHGLWLKSSKVTKYLQWKSPCADERNKFVIKGIQGSPYLTNQTPFYLVSLKWQHRAIAVRQEAPGVGLIHLNLHLHRCFLCLKRHYDDFSNRKNCTHLIGKVTMSAFESLPHTQREVSQVSISVMGPSSSSSGNTSILSPSLPSTIGEDKPSTLSDKITQMESILGSTEKREVLANYLDGADGNVQLALEHYFMANSSSACTPTITTTNLSQGDLFSRGSSASSSSASSSSSAHYEKVEELKHSEEMDAKPNDLYLESPNDNSKNDTKNLIMPPAVVESHRRSSSQLIIPMPTIDIKETPLSIEENDTRNSLNDFTLHQQVPPPVPISVQSEVVAPPSASSTSIEESDQTIVENSSLSIEDFEMLSVLGRGSFGAVMMVRYKCDGRIFALKILKKTNMSNQDVLNAKEERAILQRIDHPYISSLLFAFQTKERLYLGMKYYAAGDLFYHLNLRGRISLRCTKLYAAELVLALSYLHNELNILYRDLKPSNIMIDGEGHIGVVDFGLSKQHIYGVTHGVKTLSGTAEYVAPEALRKKDGTRDYGKAFDWWSFGIVLYEMLMGESPFYDENEHVMLDRIAHDDLVFANHANLPDEAKDLISKLLIRDPTKRLGSTSSDEIKSHSFFSDIDWVKLQNRSVDAFWIPKLSSETDTKYVDPEFIDEGPPSAAYDPSAHLKRKNKSSRFSQFSFDYRIHNN